MVLIYNKYLAILSYLTVCLVWGSTYLAIRVGVTDMPFLVFAGVRFISAGLIIGFAGVIYLFNPHLTMEGRTLPAMLAVIGASLNWAIASIYLKRRIVSVSMMPDVGIQ